MAGSARQTSLRDSSKKEAQQSIKTFFDGGHTSERPKDVKSLINTIPCPICSQNLAAMMMEDRETHVYGCMGVPETTGNDAFLTESEFREPAVEKPSENVNIGKLGQADKPKVKRAKRKKEKQLEDIYKNKRRKKKVKNEIGTLQSTIDAEVSNSGLEKEVELTRTEVDIKIEEMAHDESPPREEYTDFVKSESFSFDVSSIKVEPSDGAAAKRSSKIPPFFKVLKLHDKSLAVDAFCYGAIANVSSYFLTHFHSDHYGGLRKSWSAGLIYCSEATARLCQLRLGLDAEWLRPLPTGKFVQVEGVDVLLLDANHCPGSSIILFRYKGESILHTGDFRACQKQIDDLATIHQGYLNTIYLDTTYLNPKYCFPAQEDVIEACADYCVSLKTQGGDPPSTGLTLDGFFEFMGVPFRTSKKKANPVVFVGSYVIGKERLAIGIAKKLGSKIFPSGSDKSRVLEALQDPELDELLSDNGLECSVHIMRMMDLNPASIAQHWKALSKKFTHLIVFSPTGWNFRASKKQVEASIEPKFGLKELEQCRTMTNGGKVHRLSVPYSEHSSFPELRRFIEGVKAYEVIPTVNMNSERSRSLMKFWLDRWQGK